MAAKSRQFTADKTGKGQFLRRNRRNLAREGVMRKILSPQRVASVSNLCTGPYQLAGNMSNEECCSGFDKQSTRLFLGNPTWPRSYWKLRATREERESERSYKSQKDFGWRNAEKWLTFKCQLNVDNSSNLCSSYLFKRTKFEF